LETTVTQSLRLRLQIVRNLDCKLV